MLLKRILLAIISLAVGFTVTFLVVRFIGDTTIAEYGPLYTFFTSLAIACALGIWLDKFMGTEILPK